MKRLLILFGLLISLVGYSQIQPDFDLTNQINTTIRGKVFNAKSHADMFNTIVDSKLNRSSLSGWSTGTLTGDVFIDMGLGTNRTFALVGGLGGNHLTLNDNFFSLRSFYSGYGGTYYSIFANYPTGVTPYTEWMTNASGSRYGIQLRYGGSLANRNIDFVLAGVANLRIDNPAGTFFYTIGRSAITGNRTVTLPLLTADDTFVTAAFSQSLTNKTLGSGTVFSAAPTINDGLRFTFNPNGTNAGINVGAHTAAPSSPQNADLYYNSTSNELFARINGAWVSLGAGGGFTNGAANNELIKSDGTNGVASGIFSLSSGQTIQFGSASLGSTFRDFTLEGSEANINFRWTPKGTGAHIFQGTNFFVNTSQAAFTNTHQVGIEPSNKRIVFTRLTDTPSTWIMRGSTGTAGNNNGDDFTISGGHAFLSGTGNGGNLILEGGSNNSGSGNNGVVYTRYQGELINLALFEPVSEIGTSFTFDYSHLSKLVVANNAGAITATVPALQVGYITKAVQDGAGTFSITAGANVVLVGKTSTTGIGDTIVIHAYKTSGSDTYYLCE